MDGLTLLAEVAEASSAFPAAWKQGSPSPALQWRNLEAEALFQTMKCFVTAVTVGQGKGRIFSNKA